MLVHFFLCVCVCVCVSVCLSVSLTHAASCDHKVKCSAIMLIGGQQQKVVSHCTCETWQPNRDQVALSEMIVQEASPDSVVIADVQTSSYGPCPLSPDNTNHNHAMRFYAGVPLLVQGHKIGTLSLADPRPRPDLDTHSTRETLRDVAGILSEILAEQRHKAVSYDNDFAKISVGLFAHLQQPLRAVRTAVETAQLQCRQRVRPETGESASSVLWTDRVHAKPSEMSTTVSAAAAATDIASTDAIAVNSNRITDADITAVTSDVSVQHEDTVEALAKHTAAIEVRVKFLSLVVENCLQLSLSLFRRLQASEAADLIPMHEMPALVQFLSETVRPADQPLALLPQVEFLSPRGAKDLYSNPHLPDSSSAKRQSFAGSNSDSSAVAYRGVNLARNGVLAATSVDDVQSWFLGINVSMLWTLLFSLLSRHSVSQVQLSVQSDQLDALPLSDGVEAVFSLLFVCQQTHACTLSMRESNDECHHQQDEPQLQLAVEYLVKSFGGQLSLTRNTNPGRWSR
jgi:hypothetical protein